MTFPFTYSRDALSVFIGGVPQTVHNSHPKWDEIFAIVTGKVASDEATLKALLDTRAVIAAEVAKANFNRVTVGIDAILLDGKPVHSYLANRMMEMVKQGIDVAPWARFMEKLYNNPSKTAVEELYLWLEQANMPITENGNFLAYKKVKDDYTSYHKNADGSECRNDLGSTVSMPRNEVDDNRERTCSQGLHFCAWTYLPSYMGGSGKVVVVEIDPADVVSIPSDYNNAKGRAWRYLVRSEIEEETARFAFEGQLVVANSDYEWDEEQDDEDEDEREYNDWLDVYVDEDGMVDPDDFEDIDWSELKLVSSLIRQPDGSFTGTYEHVDASTVRLDVQFDEDMDATNVRVYFA
jgi:hypothetical protein